MMNEAASTAIAATGVFISCKKGCTAAQNYCMMSGLSCCSINKNRPGTISSNTPPVEMEENDNDNLEDDEQGTAIDIEEPQPEPSMEPQPGPSKRQQIM